MSSFSKQIWVVHPLNPSKVFSDPPFWVLSYDWSLLLFSYNQVILLKFSPPPQGINNDQSLTIEYIHVPEPSSLFRVDSEESHESAHTWLFAIPPKLAKVTKGKSLSTLGARGFSCAVAGFFFSPFVPSAKGRRRVCLRPTKLLVAREKKPLVPRLVSQIKSIEKSVKEVTYVCPQGHMHGTCCQLHW